MSPELTNKLKDEFPEMYEGIKNEKFRREPIYYGFTCDDGWFDIIRNFSVKYQQYINTLSPELKQEYKIYQVKEKFGRLVIYAAPYNDATIRALVEEASKEASDTCEKCGAKDAVLRPDIGWVRTLCDSHYLEKKAGVMKDFSEEELAGMYETINGRGTFEQVKHRFLITRKEVKE